MIIDSSALLAILFNEPDAQVHAEAIAQAQSAHISAANWLETAIRIDHGGSPIASNAMDDLIREARIEIAPVTADHVSIARQAYRAYGKGTGHPAQLNFGDCFSYALAKSTRQPLLFKGNDFSHTDLPAALKPL
ncbi:type II toxin-antitoxin system VapC family toxin [Wenzhouxiangella sp. C33]|uniref:Ribonuclease VapC n=2 Tax=Wenzhouxiangella limi TaxID=2707351 RepID=A0A845V5R8_9GAMM|nr:type II toxin-antitoxin system VapC family toxin [Wenzhouxiangella limi]